MKTKSKELQAGCNVLKRYFWKWSKNRRRLEGKKRERQTCTHERILERLKPEKKAIFFCIVGNESKCRTYPLKISCCVVVRFFFYSICKQTALISGSKKLYRPSI